MNRDDLKADAQKAGDALEHGADWLAAAGIKSPYGWIIYAAFLGIGIAIGALL